MENARGVGPGSDTGLFGTCGVRGVVGEAITDEVVERLARSFASQVGAGRRVCVGRDTRRSGPQLEDKLVGELASCGVDVLRLGVIPTPGVYFLTRELGCDGGVMVTASHSPPEYNGFKLCNHLGMLPDTAAIEAGYHDPPRATAPRSGSIDTLDGIEEFLTRLRAICPPPLEKLRLVVDCACGPGSAHLPGFLRDQGHEVLERNCELDVEQCDRVVEPRADTLGKTVEFLREHDADAGLCFDGDNDRVVFLDPEGFLGFQRGNAAVAQAVLETARNKHVVGTVETGRFVEEAVKRAGGTLHRSVVGDVHVARALMAADGALGLEECGHYVIPQAGYFSETLFPATLLLARRDMRRLREELSTLPSVVAGEERIDCAKEQKGPAMERIARVMRDLDGDLATTDGVRVDWEDGWLLVRPSGTSPYMKVNAEALAEDRLAELVALGVGFVREALR